MLIATAIPLGLVTLVVCGPLVYEYVSLRRDLGLSHAAAAAAIVTLLPSLALGIAVALPLSGRPVLQWSVTVVATLTAYSVAVAALRARLGPQSA
jgi:hypothetical protein